MVSTKKGCNQWLSLAKTLLKVALAGGNRLLIAPTSKCGRAIRVHPHIHVRAINKWWVPALVATSGFHIVRVTSERFLPALVTSNSLHWPNRLQKWFPASRSHSLVACTSHKCGHIVWQLALYNWKNFLRRWMKSLAHLEIYHYRWFAKKRFTNTGWVVRSRLWLGRTGSYLQMNWLSLRNNRLKFSSAGK